jgi:hypothetical protein
LVLQSANLGARSGCEKLQTLSITFLYIINMFGHRLHIIVQEYQLGCVFFILQTTYEWSAYIYIQYCSVGNIPLQGQDKVKSEGQLTGPSAVCLSNCSDPDLSVFIGQGRRFVNDYCTFGTFIF